METVPIPPGATVVAAVVLVMARSTCGMRLSVSVAELLAGVASVTPAGAVMLAVVTRVPVAVGETVATIL